MWTLQKAGSNISLQSNDVHCSSTASLDYVLSKWQDHLILRESSRFRISFMMILMVALIYMGLVFPFRLCFVEFHLPASVPEVSFFWEAMEVIVDIIFWVDLAAGFIFSYRDQAGHEVHSPRLIAKRYLKGYFWINFFACAPPSLVSIVVTLVSGQRPRDTSINKGARLTRLQRITQIGKVLKVLRVTNAIRFTPRRENALRGARLAKLSALFLGVIHLVACGWYLCAALHDDVEMTWVARREILDASSMEQWCHAMYFIFTVFTTVGFGDLYAITLGEVMFVMVAMFIGVIVNSLVVGEMVNIVVTADQHAVMIARRKDLINKFSIHTEIKPETTENIAKWTTDIRFARYEDYNNEEVKKLLITCLSCDELAKLPGEFFGGRLVKNKFLKRCEGHALKIPPRLAIFIALAATRRNYRCREVVYRPGDDPSHLFLVISGTFAYVSSSRHNGNMRASSASDKGCTEDQEGEDGGDDRYSHRSESAFGLDDADWEDRGPPMPAERMQRNKFYPYKLIGADNYFGECELTTQRPRSTVARCEARGSLLLLHRSDFRQLVQEFPIFARVWAAAAAQRETCQSRLRRQNGDCKCRNFRELAALRIQRHFLIWRPSLSPRSDEYGSPRGSRHRKTLVRIGTSLDKALKVVRSNGPAVADSEALDVAAGATGRFPRGRGGSSKGEEVANPIDSGGWDTASGGASGGAGGGAGHLPPSGWGASEGPGDGRAGVIDAGSSTTAPASAPGAARPGFGREASRGAESLGGVSCSVPIDVASELQALREGQEDIRELLSRLLHPGPGCSSFFPRTPPAADAPPPLPPPPAASPVSPPEADAASAAFAARGEAPRTTAVFPSSAALAAKMDAETAAVARGAAAPALRAAAASSHDEAVEAEVAASALFRESPEVEA